jgi:hypothetical protein
MKLIFSVLDRHELWPHFRDYYQAQGVTQFLCVSYGPVLDGVTTIRANIPQQEFTGIGDAQKHNAVMRQHVRPYEWCIIADLDEFHKVPGMTLVQAIQQAQADGANHIKGHFHDRVTADGSIPEQLEDDIWQQFPLATNATQVVSGGWMKKVVAVKGSLRINGGHHALHDDCKAQGKLWQTWAQVHHFKWWGPNPARFFPSRFKGKPVYRQELEKLASYFQENGRININDLKVLPQ